MKVFCKFNNLRLVVGIFVATATIVIVIRGSLLIDLITSRGFIEYV